MVHEYRLRLKALQTWLHGQRAAAALVTAPISMKYLTGWMNPSKRFSGLLVPASGAPVLVVPALEVAEAARTVWGRLVPWTDGQDPMAVLAGALSGLGAGGPLSLEKDHLTVAALERLAAAVGAPGGPAALLDAPDVGAIITAHRATKSAAEIAHLQRAADMLNPALDAALAFIHPGVTERQIAEVINQAMLAAGAEGTAFDTHVLVGAESALPHGHTGDRAVAPGGVVLMDFGALVGGYRSDITRTVCCGEWPPELARVYEAVLAAHDAAIARAGPGVPRGALDDAARSVIAAGGYGEHFIHRTGHGLGLEIHEEPYLVGGDARPLEVGHVVTVEPGIYLPGVGGVRIEDDIVITPDGCRRLTSWRTDRISV